ncbi:hypothetical protein H4R19_002929 [Coemansia spiralis]|nr:hypothetical protein H4R19_002929 [Coemansia spiralis]
MRQSPSPPLDGSPCACCPQPYAYSQHVPYLELSEPALDRTMPMPMPWPMANTMGYMSASMPSYALPMRQKPRKRVTFADPIAQYRVVPCGSSSAPERARPLFVEPPAAGQRRCRDSIGLHRDRSQSLTGSHSSHSMVASGDHGLASGSDYNGHTMLLSSYTIHPAVSTSTGGNDTHKRRVGGSHSYGAATTKPSVLRRSHERSSHTYTDSSSFYRPRPYNEAFSLSSEHLPLPA